MNEDYNQTIKELEKTIKKLKRKERLSAQVLSQNNSILEKYNTAIENLQHKEHLTASFLESSTNAVIAIDSHQIVTIFNKVAENMFGYSKEEMLNKDSLHKIIPSEVFKKHYDSSVNFMNTRDSQGFIGSHVEQIGKRKDGSTFPIRISFNVEFDIGKINVISNIEDITKEVETREALNELNLNLERKVDIRTEQLNTQSLYLQSVIDGVNDPIMVIKDDYTVTLMNHIVKQNTKDVEILDKNNPKCYEISHNRSTPCDGLEHPCPLKEVLEKNSHVSVIHNHQVEGEDSYVELSASPLFDSENRCMGIIETARDITSHLKVQDELREQKDILDYQAHHDALTGLPNRVLFNDRLEQLIEKSKRSNSRFALLFIDLDHFKEINDSLGHAVGDEILKTITSRLKETVRDEDTVSRLGGDEFLIIIEELSQTQDASLVATKILEVLSKVIDINENLLYVSSSIGISVYPDDGQSSQDLLKYADSAMYKAKDEGRNNYQYYNSTMTELAFERVVMEASLRAALKEEQFLVYYQPQMDGKRDKLIGMEALVRWLHPTMGIVSPAKFIPLAESTGLIVALDRFVMKTAMTQIAQWYRDGFTPGVLAMNLAVKQLQQKDFIEMFENLMKETGCKPQWLELEVTEGQIMTNPQEAIKILKQISDIGIKLAVDDFGTGYSSLAYLKKLPIDKLKIDQSFIRDIPDDEEDVAITRAVIALAKSLKLEIIAEGVENKEQKDFIVENGCENIQGYFYSKPIPADEFKSILLNGDV